VTGSGTGEAGGAGGDMSSDAAAGVSGAVTSGATGRPSTAFHPLALGNVTLRNRMVRAGCFEGLSPAGEVSDNLVEHHRRVAAGGIGMTTLSYCSVSRDGRAFGHELWLRPGILPGLRRFVQAIHSEGAAASIQLGHCGFFASPAVIGCRPLGASPKFCVFRLSYCRAMTQEDIRAKTADFVSAARLAQEAGFDAVEIHAGHGYLLSQFLSPWTNRRTDDYGGPLHNRLRFPVAVVKEVRAALGPGFPILVKMNLDDGMKGGLDVDEAVQVATALEAAGAGALVPSCGFTARTPLYMLRGDVPTLQFARAQPKLLTKVGMAMFGWAFVQRYPFEPCFLENAAHRILEAVDIPVAYVGGVRSLADIERLLAQGFAFVQLGRATVRDPRFAARLQRGEIAGSDCDSCNRCIAAMSVSDVTCALSEQERLRLVPDS
jgi:2,4-dienoyl-CoA reductase-like NADH-dependent reductase (Old Yellow Enzyme family)